MACEKSNTDFCQNRKRLTEPNIKAIEDVLNRGRDAEIRLDRNREVVVYEVRKNKV